MTITTKPSVSGFIATDPKRSETREGRTKFYARFAQSHAQRNDDGTFTPLDSSFSNLVAYGEAAEWALANLQKGDAFIAQGNERSYMQERDGRPVEGEEFIANKISHDPSRHPYVVDRTSRPARGPQRQTQPSPLDDPFNAASRPQSQAAPALGR
ncbi:single-stranded DNA-binding protein [Microbacterium profundi]|uniref:Single-stranded DNA-binding protein n=1 Tax=Microbacterium profundi TaxID=450380 RepID=A0ABV3LNI8_9MICO